MIFTPKSGDFGAKIKTFLGSSRHHLISDAHAERVH
jgi:hypothetical protein